ncbi:chemotaxis protein CheW [Hydrogenophaga sp.]|uniref:chemotaxis protein CheW n=1 Tax=Hydrogenophaga sp. TaxID=1904254 RepID=UPI00198A8FB5|nr:chemotaxis protein CheW [Hydrogenophaga sp.]MBD3893077.1 chemotaxis protein CheW [Hydrogenophaga sp.]
MGNRQSLRELQERLALRLSSAQSQAPSAAWLAVQAGEQNFLLPLVQAGEIFSLTSIHPVPYTQAWYLGVVNLRSALYGVVDLTGLCARAQPPAAPGVAGRLTSESRLVGLHPALGVNAVLWVDRLLGLRNPASFSGLGQLAAAAPPYGARCLVDHQGLSWLELDLQVLAADPAFLAIAA